MKIQETGFVEFVTDLINSTIDGVISSQLEQEKKYIELKKDLFLNNSDFITKYNLLEKAKAVLGEKADEKDVETYVNNYITEYKETLKEYLNKNALKVIVDRGKVNAKLIFSFSETEETPTTKKQVKTLKKTRPSTIQKLSLDKSVFNNKIDKLILADKNLITRDQLNLTQKVIVKPIDVNKDMLDLKTDIVSNVEFSFRTIVQ
ncbi:hypothetical protein [Tenacibaculum geojense]|uniref:Uncharacterized protein n=1 Tax=Tenacibaculum geojense TaxID=915352 RepID=A0ABW3JPV1_9FLAO